MKKLSGTNRPEAERPLDLPPIFVDRALDSPRFVEPLKVAQIRIGHLTGFLEIYAHNDLFAPDTPDEIWIRHCGQNGWIAFTKDRAIKYRQLEKQAVQAYNARLFNLATRKNMTAGENAQAFLKAIPRIAQFVRRHDPPFIAKVSRDSKVEMAIAL